jgi:penicillin-binding protein 2
MGEDTYTNSNKRLRLFYLMFAAMVIILIAGLTHRQLMLYGKYKEEEQRQNYRRILMPGPRGDIYDRNGELLVGNRPLFKAVVYLNELRKEFRTTYYKMVRDARQENKRLEEAGLPTKKLSSNKISINARKQVVQKYLDQINVVLNRHETLEHENIERHWHQSLLLPMTLISDLTEEDYAKLIEQIPIDSPIQVITDNARYYPHNAAACHVLGFTSPSTDYPDDRLPEKRLITFTFPGKVGRTGLEKAFNKTLQGQSGGEIWVVDPSGFQYERTNMVAPVKGKNITTSLDIRLQEAVENAMGDHIGAAVALDVHSGEVLVMASKPNFDLNELSPVLTYKTDARIREEGGWLNRCIQGLYPPGSTFKLITAVALLHTGTIDLDTVVECTGRYMVGRRAFPCHRRWGHGPETVKDAIRDSCNVFFYAGAVKMGIEPLAAMARTFGLDEKTGIELPAETGRTVVADPAYKKRRFYENWYDGDTANTAIGQGFMLVTPLQMACVTASLARGETRTYPSIIHDPSHNTDHGGKPIPLDNEQYQGIIEGMIMATEEGTAKLVRIPGITIASKTGTAEIPVKGKETTLAWYVGFAPAEKPEVAIAVMIEGTDPRDSFHGGSTAGPIARTFYKKYFEYKQTDAQK